MNAMRAVKNYDLTEITRLLLKMRDNCVRKEDEAYDDPERKEKYEALNDAVDLINNPSLLQMWVDTKRALPSKGSGQVLVLVDGAYKNCCFLKAVQLAEYTEDEGWIIEGYEEWEDPQIDWWMPLPEPPEEE